jgi:ABC-type transport system involved in multi-copper enzyme maturation permease subunit
LIRLVRAELLKMRRRTATYVVLAVALALMGATYLLVGGALGGFQGRIDFPAAYSLIGQFAFGLGGLLAVVYAAAIVGADWNWGVLRNVIARGEGRARYLLAKGIALAIVLALGTLVIFAVGMVLTYVVGVTANVTIGSPLRGRGLLDLVDNLALGYPVLLQRASIGLAVAVLLRSQLAGAVVGIVLYVGEQIITGILTVTTLVNHMGDVDFQGLGFSAFGPEWFQYLPISLGGNVLGAAPGGSSATSGGGVEQLILRPVPLDVALPMVLLYLVAALVIAVLALSRQEIV